MTEEYNVQAVINALKEKGKMDDPDKHDWRPSLSKYNPDITTDHIMTCSKTKV